MDVRHTSPERAIEEPLRNLAEGMYCVRWGHVTKWRPGRDFDRADIKLDVERTVKIDGVETREIEPELLSVPILYPAATKFAISFPLEKGDKVLVLYHDTCTEEYVAGDGAECTTAIPRAHARSDSFAVPTTIVPMWDRIPAKRRGLLRKSLYLRYYDGECWVTNKDAWHVRGRSIDAKVREHALVEAGDYIKLSSGPGNAVGRWEPTGEIELNTNQGLATYHQSPAGVTTIRGLSVHIAAYGSKDADLVTGDFEAGAILLKNEKSKISVDAEQNIEIHANEGKVKIDALKTGGINILSKGVGGVSITPAKQIKIWTETPVGAIISKYELDPDGTLRMWGADAGKIAIGAQGIELMSWLVSFSSRAAKILTVLGDQVGSLDPVSKAAIDGLNAEAAQITGVL